MVSMPISEPTSATASTAVSRVSGSALESAVAKNATSSATVPSTSPRSAPMITDVAICEAASRRATRAIMRASSGNLRASAVSALCADASALLDLPATEANTGAMSSGPPNSAKGQERRRGNIGGRIGDRSAERQANGILVVLLAQIGPSGRSPPLEAQHLRAPQRAKMRGTADDAEKCQCGVGFARDAIVDERVDREIDGRCPRQSERPPPAQRASPPRLPRRPRAPEAGARAIWSRGAGEHAFQARFAMSRPSANSAKPRSARGERSRCSRLRAPWRARWPLRRARRAKPR